MRKTSRLGVRALISFSYICAPLLSLQTRSRTPVAGAKHQDAALQMQTHHAHAMHRHRPSRKMHKQMPQLISPALGSVEDGHCAAHSLAEDPWIIEAPPLVERRELSEIIGAEIEVEEAELREDKRRARRGSGVCLRWRARGGGEDTLQGEGAA